MTMRTARQLIVLGVSLALGPLVVGCSDDTSSPDPTSRARSTKTGLIQYFTQAHEGRDGQKYAECLHPDYSFEFLLDLCGDPAWGWGDVLLKTEDVAVAGKMFTDASVESIEAEFTNTTQIGDSTTPDENRFFGQNIDVGGTIITVYRGTFEVDMNVLETPGDKSDGEEADFRVQVDVEMTLRRDPVDENLWTIWKIRDWGLTDDADVHSVSWTRLKEQFRP